MSDTGIFRFIHINAISPFGFLPSTVNQELCQTILDLLKIMGKRKLSFLIGNNNLFENFLRSTHKQCKMRQSFLIKMTFNISADLLSFLNFIFIFRFSQICTHIISTPAVCQHKLVQMLFDGRSTRRKIVSGRKDITF